MVKNEKKRSFNSAKMEESPGRAGTEVEFSLLVQAKGTFNLQNKHRIFYHRTFWIRVRLLVKLCDL